MRAAGLEAKDKLKRYCEFFIQIARPADTKKSQPMLLTGSKRLRAWVGENTRLPLWD